MVDEIVIPSRICNGKLNRTFMKYKLHVNQCNTEICTWNEDTSPIARAAPNLTILSRDWNDTFDENKCRDNNLNIQIEKKKTTVSNVEVIVLRSLSLVHCLI